MTGRRRVFATLVVATAMVVSGMALPLLGGTALAETGDAESGQDVRDVADRDASSQQETSSRDVTEESTPVPSSNVDAGVEVGATDVNADAGAGVNVGTDADGSFDLVEMGPTTADTADTDAGAAAGSDASADATAALSQAQTEAVEAGVDEGIELAQSQGVEVSQEQRAAAIDAASQSVVQHQNAEVEQIQSATAGAVHGSLLQSQDVEVEQYQSAIGGATEGALAQYQSVSASQMQSATWGATHGALAQKQRVDVEQTQVATRGAAAGACREAGDKGVTEGPKIQEAAQGSAYGVIEQYQTITAEQRQRVTLEHVQHAAAGASAGSLEGSTETAVEQEQGVDVEQRQRVNIKQIQKAATGAAKGALVQRQEVTVEQTQAAARGAGKGSLTQIQTARVEQVQRISITQIQEASFGAAKGSIYQSQEATVRQIQAAADGAAGGVLVQQQEISITQIQYAAVGASQGAIESAVQYQNVEIEQVQAAAFGAGQGAVIQKQVVDITQVQKLALGGASGALIQYQEATVEQIQIAASGACQETARVVQYQRISVTQLQVLTQDAASGAAQYAAQQDTTDVSQITEVIRDDVDEDVEQIEEREGTARITFDEQDSEGETVTVDGVELSEGGFVALYEGDAVADPAAVIGASGYLEAGSYSDLEIELDERIESDQPLVAVVHRDTNDDGTFQFTESDGTEDDPYVSGAGSPVLDTASVSVDGDEAPAEPNATLEVADQAGDGGNLTVDEANATVDYAVTATANETTAESQSFAANETVTDLDLELEPPLENNATVDVAVVDENGTELTNETIEYTVEDAGVEPVEPNATLEVSNQTGSGETLIVDEANATVDYRLTVTDWNGTQLAASDVFEGNESVESESLALEPPLENNATVDVAVVDENGTELANESVGYAIEAEPASFNVSIAGTNSPVERGEPLEVDADVENVGAGAGSQVVELAIDDTVVNESTVSLEPNATESLNLTAETTDLEPGEYPVTVSSDNESAETTVTVEEAGQADFGVSISGTNSPVEQGEQLEVGTEVENVGPESGAQNVTLAIGDAVVDEENVSLEAGATESFNLTAETTDLEPGEYPVTVSSENETAETTVTVEEPGQAEFGVSITETNSPVEQGEPLEVGADIENVGPESGVQNVTLAIGDSVVDEETVDLDSGATDSVDLTAETDDLEPGEYSVAVSSENESAETTVSVEEPGAPEFGVSITGTNAPIEQGEGLEVDAQIDNVGDAEGTQTVTLAVGDAVVDEESVSLEAGASDAVTLTADTSTLEPDDYTAIVSSENESAETTVSVEEPGEPEFAVAGLDAPQSGEPGEQVTVDATIENVGDAEGTQTVTYTADGQVLAEESVTLEAGASTTLTFTATLPETDSTQTVATDDDESSVTIAVTAPPEDEPGTADEPTDEEPLEPPGEGPPGDEPPGEGPPGDEPPGEGPPGDEPPGEGPPGDGPPGEGPPGDGPPGEGPPGDGPPGEGPPGDGPPGEGPTGPGGPGSGPDANGAEQPTG